MDALQTLIVDDESLARMRLRILLGDCRAPEAVVAGEADSAPQALALAQHTPIDVALLDIHMPGMDGMQLAQDLLDLPNAPQVVFVTAYAQHAAQAFDLDAADYLTKPVRLERLQAALQKVARIIAAQRSVTPLPESEYFTINERDHVVRIPLKDVRYLKAELKYITVGTTRRQYMIDASLNQLEEKYAGRFIRVHRNALVSRQAIRELTYHRDARGAEGWAVRLAGVEQPILISRRQIGLVKEALAL